METSTWLPPAAIIAVVLYVWRRTDRRMDEVRADLAGLRLDLADVDRRLARVEGGP